MGQLLGALLALAVAAPDPHSLGNPQAVRPRHLSLDLTLRFEEKAVGGACELELEYVDPEAATHLDLDTENLRVEKVLDPATGKALPFVVEPPARSLGQRLRIALLPDRPRRVRVAYQTSPSASALQWLEPRQTTSGRMPFLFTQGQAIHARSWIPTMDSPGVRATYDAVVRVPAGMRVVMSAEHLEHDPAKGVFRFRCSPGSGSPLGTPTSRPIPPSMPSWSARGGSSTCGRCTEPSRPAPGPRRWRAASTRGHGPATTRSPSPASTSS